MDKKTRLVFKFMASKFQSWWRRSVNTDEKYERMVREFTVALEPYSVDQIKRAFVVINKLRAECKLMPPPTADRFVRIMLSHACAQVVMAARPEVAQLSREGRRHLEAIKSRLGG